MSISTGAPQCAVACGTRGSASTLLVRVPPRCISPACGTSGSASALPVAPSRCISPACPRATGNVAALGCCTSLAPSLPLPPSLSHPLTLSRPTSLSPCTSPCLVHLPDSLPHLPTSCAAFQFGWALPNYNAALPSASSTHMAPTRLPARLPAGPGHGTMCMPWSWHTHAHTQLRTVALRPRRQPKHLPDPGTPAHGLAGVDEGVLIHQQQQGQHRGAALRLWAPGAGVGRGPAEDWLRRTNCNRDSTAGLPC